MSDKWNAFYDRLELARDTFKAFWPGVRVYTSRIAGTGTITMHVQPDHALNVQKQLNDFTESAEAASSEFWVVDRLTKKDGTPRARPKVQIKTR